jgi:hypothetical protein
LTPHITYPAGSLDLLPRDVIHIFAPNARLCFIPLAVKYYSDPADQMAKKPSQNASGSVQDSQRENQSRPYRATCCG